MTAINPKAGVRERRKLKLVPLLNMGAMNLRKGGTDKPCPLAALLT